MCFIERINGYIIDSVNDKYNYSTNLSKKFSHAGYLAVVPTSKCHFLYLFCVCLFWTGRSFMRNRRKVY